LVASRSRKVAIDPALDIQDDQFLVDDVKKVVKAAFVKLECFVSGTGYVVKMLAAAWLCVLIESAMKDQNRQHDQEKFLLEALVGPNHRCHSL
jgi:hypothetical protein